MKETLSTTITKSSQVTLPAAAQRALGVKPGDRLEVTFDAESITIRAPKYTFADVFASVPALPGGDPQDFESMIAAAQDEQLAKERRKLDAP